MGSPSVRGCRTPSSSSWDYLYHSACHSSRERWCGRGAFCSAPPERRWLVLNLSANLKRRSWTKWIYATKWFVPHLFWDGNGSANLSLFELFLLGQYCGVDDRRFLVLGCDWNIVRWHFVDLRVSDRWNSGENNAVQSNEQLERINVVRLWSLKECFTYNCFGKAAGVSRSADKNIFTLKSSTKILWCLEFM